MSFFGLQTQYLDLDLASSLAFTEAVGDSPMVKLRHPDQIPTEKLSREYILGV